MSIRKRYTNESIIECFKEVHGELFDYSQLINYSQIH